MISKDNNNKIDWNRYLFFIKAMNFFALFAYDIGVDCNAYVKSFSDNMKKYDLSQKLKHQLKQMEETRLRLEHHTQGVSNQMAEILEKIEDTSNYTPLSFLFETMDAWNGLFEVFSYLLLSGYENPRYYQRLYNDLMALLNIPEEEKRKITAPDWDKMIEVYNNNLKENKKK